MDILWIVCGLTGTFVCALATLCVMRGKLIATTWKYPFINIVCSILIMLSLLGQFSITLLIIELFWLFMSIYAYIRAIGVKR